MMTSLDSHYQTERFGLVPFEESYISEEYLSWLNDPILMRYSEQRHVIHTVETARKFLMSFENSQNRFLACVSKDSKKHFGNVVFNT
jgi:[ribosomal protein S5]-alanine N-acetyltransferase